ncbi:hypothetical protein JM18_005128 [Phytophthora kernoviae]|uniref:Putative restriction endonuclease domain-containing protein n=1 Tax=Phytophthora kernoviae TaxID=325452 RepID=A0A8T0M2K7_9STRA|nr:hypothetical protein JM18_005128 [Phytophthora kernoviae]KAG2527200.1 hypothetical protein JM16_003528 [Phytophthora kernoviae]
MADKQKPHQDVLTRLVHNLETKKTLCHVKDYPGVELKQLNDRVQEIGPLVNPVFGEQFAFFIDDDDDRFFPCRMVTYGHAKVAAKIAALLGNWAKWSGKGGRAATSQGTFVFGTDVRIPDISYTSCSTHRGLSTGSTWTYRGEPYAPTFVVEIDELSGQGSQRSALDRKMRNEYFQHGVQLGWLIDPRPDCHNMYEYYLDENGEVQCAANTAWRDLDGGDVLPGFTLVSIDLDMVLSQDSGSSSEEEVDLWHRAERSIAKYLARHENA